MWPSRSKKVERFTVFIPLQSVNQEAAGSVGTREINPLADPPFARLPQRSLLDQKYYRRINRFHSTFQPYARSFLVQPGSRADAQHVCSQRDAKPKQQRTKARFMPVVVDSCVLAHRNLTFPISTNLRRNRP